MTFFDLAAVLVTVAAISGYLNHRVLRLPPTSGTLVVALAGSLAAIAADAVFPALRLRAGVAAFVANIDFNQTLMRGMLGFLLFAGALNVDVRALLAHKWTIGLLSTLGVLISTVLVGAMTWVALRLIGTAAPLPICLLFGAIVSPTDPIAVLALLKQVGAPADLEAQIAGESLFNDGVGVVVFFALLSAAGTDVEPASTTVLAGAPGLLVFFLREVAGGAALGYVVGYSVCAALRRVDDAPLELLMTVALVMATYAVSFPLHVSGPIAVVVAGLVIGYVGHHAGADATMSPGTRAHVEAFWAMIDELLNTVLFLLIGLQVLAVPTGLPGLVAAALTVPIALVARLAAVGIPVAALSLAVRRVRGFVPVLTWSGLRGGLSVAMALSLPPFPERGLILDCTYAVVIFSILVQGLTMRRLLVYYGLTAEAGDSTRSGASEVSR